MSRRLKIGIVVVSLIGLLAYVGYQFMQRKMLEPSYVDVPTLSGKIIENKVTTPDGHERIYEYYRPASLHDTTTIIYALHGSTSSGQDIRKQFAYEWDVLADKHGLIIVYPTGYDNHWNDCWGKADYQANVQNIDDLGFLKMVEARIVDQSNTIVNRRFATGFSNGGHYCFKLALEAPDWIDGIAAVSANLPVAENRDCDPSDIFVPTMVVNGTDDWINPYEGGLVSIRGNDSRGVVHSSLETMSYFTGLSDCLPQSSIALLSDTDREDDSVIEAFTFQCTNFNQVLGQLYKVNNGGHTLPHPKSQLPPILGNTNRDIVIAEEIWGFFEKVDN